MNFTTTSAEFKSRTGVICGIKQKVGQMYQMRVRPRKLDQEWDFAAVAKGRTLDKWHWILGHVNPWTVQTMQKNSLVTGLIINKSQTPTQCTTCIQGKRHVDPFLKDAQTKVDNIGNRILSDVWGPAQTEGLAWGRYFYSFTDARSQYLVIYFGNTKDGVLKNFATFKEFIETQSGNKVKKS